MPHLHSVQYGTFHIITNAAGQVPWCIHQGVPQILIDNLMMTRNLQKAHVYAFCILPDHLHLIMSPGEKGLSKFMHSFKKNSTRDIKNILGDVASKFSWQKGYFDERIKSDAQRSEAFWYVQGNAKKHELVEEMEDWPWSSIQFSTLMDPMEIWV